MMETNCFRPHEIANQKDDHLQEGTSSSHSESLGTKPSLRVFKDIFRTTIEDYTWSKDSFEIISRGFGYYKNIIDLNGGKIIGLHNYSL
jgi:hypothetical protein